MARRLPTKGSMDFLQRLLQAFQNQVTSNWTEDVRQSATNSLNKIATSRGDFLKLEQLGLVLENPEKSIRLDDQSAHMTVEQNWKDIISEDIMGSLGRHGDDAISCVGEGVLYANAIALLFGAKRVFYRGEQEYGWSLMSRAERHMNLDLDHGVGITNTEIEEIERFQESLLSDDSLVSEIFHGHDPYERSDPRWLPIMQHYDNAFGTRLLDLTSSIYSGLYFACVGWDGQVDEDNDGLLYVFLDGSANWRGYYLDSNSTKASEFDDVVPIRLEDSFRDWKAPEYYRLYSSSYSNPREMAQDGFFLVKGVIGVKREHGTGFKFRIPRKVKARIVRELWLSGYTPERMVRGDIGRTAHNRIASFLKL